MLVGLQIRKLTSFQRQVAERMRAAREAMGVLQDKMKEVASQKAHLNHRIQRLQDECVHLECAPDNMADTVDQVEWSSTAREQAAFSPLSVGQGRCRCRYVAQEESGQVPDGGHRACFHLRVGRQGVQRPTDSCVDRRCRRGVHHRVHA